MLKMIERFKPITILSATLLVVIGLLLPTYTEADQLLYDMAALKDAGSLAVKLQDTRAAVSNTIASQLSDGTQRLLGEYDGASEPSVDLRKALLSDLNRRIQAGPLYDAQLFADIKLSEQDAGTYCPKSEKWRCLGSPKPFSPIGCFPV